MSLPVNDYTEFINKVFAQKVKDIKDLYGKDISYMSWVPMDVPRDDRGNPYPFLSPDEVGGSHHVNKTVSINLRPDKVIKHWALKDTTPEEFLRCIIGHELLHELQHRKHMTNAQMRSVVDRANAENFTTPYLDKVSDPHRFKETMVEYMNQDLMKLDRQRRQKKNLK